MVLMETLRPATPKELSDALASAAAGGKRITLGGAFTKDRMAGALERTDVTISTAGLTKILQYEPKDLTVSVEAGLPFAELSRHLAKDGLMLPLDPPFFERATVGGVVCANTCGPRRRLYGTPKDVCIGMKFATVDSKLVTCGGMVVKNAAGLDLAKLIVGSFGTLAAAAVINFKLVPIPPATRTFLFACNSLGDAFARRDRILRGVLQPAAVDILNDAAARRIGREGCLLLVQGGGSLAAMNRYSKELEGAEAMEGEPERALWESVREFIPGFLDEFGDGGVARVSTTLSGLEGAVGHLTVPVVLRAGSGAGYACFERCEDACAEVARGNGAVLEFRSSSGCDDEQWPNPSGDFAMMERTKQLFDPRRLLNRGRLYGRI